MSEVIDLEVGANSICTSEDAFEKFQSESMIEEDDYITLSDIVPPRPDVSQELNEIPYDNEVVLDSPQIQSDEPGHVKKVNKHKQSQILDVSRNNSVSETYQDISDQVCQDEVIPSDLEIYADTQKKKELHYFSSDGLGAQNYVIEDSTSMIQDSLLSTTVGQSDSQFDKPQTTDKAACPRRTKRGRIPNSAKYSLSLSSVNSESNSNINTPVKRRPGRPRKTPLPPTSFEPDSTNGSITESSNFKELTPNTTCKRGKRGRPKVSNDIVAILTPKKRGRKPTKATPLITSEKLHISKINKDTLVKSSEIDNEKNQSNLDSSQNNEALRQLKRKGKGQKKGQKLSTVTASDEMNTVKLCERSDDDADDVCLSKLKKGLHESDKIPNTDSKLFDDIKNQKNIEMKPTDEGQEINIINDLKNDAHNETIVSSQDEPMERPSDNVNIAEEINENSNKRIPKVPIRSDFEYNIDKVVKEASTESQNQESVQEESLLIEDTSKRRRTAKKSFVYDEGSDEDPFANVESSDDEPRQRKKGTKYYSDDEYVPGRGKKRGKIRSSSSESDSDINDIDELHNLSNKNKKKLPKKVVKPLDHKTLVTTITPTKTHDDDIEGCLQTSVIKNDEAVKPPAEAWATSNEFQNFIAQKIQGTNLKIKKVTGHERTEQITPLDIPVLEPNEPKKRTETSTQTSKPSTSTSSVQTSAPYDVPMKTNNKLTPAQSKKACEFLSSVVKTTVELGQLMSQKSEDFMSKKINTENVTDTFKMDYCVRKSFLLFKLAKHNLLQMEEDLASQYERFLHENNLSSCRELPKEITPKAKVESDSDCEIVEEVATMDPIKSDPKKPKYNPKTVFLNKELSIKITKKPSTPEKPSPGKNKLEIKGRHAVWINKNVMIKKVTPNQSFLAQDSRNKKPPDMFVTKKMVSDFFEGYNRKKALIACAPFINTDWSHIQRDYACYYSWNEVEIPKTSQNSIDCGATSTENDGGTSNANYDNLNESKINENPKTLFSLCAEVISKNVNSEYNKTQTTQKLKSDFTDGTDKEGPLTLFRICMNALRIESSHTSDDRIIQDDQNTEKSNCFLALPDNTNNIEHIMQDSCHLHDLLDEDNYTNKDKNILNEITDEFKAKVIKATVLPLSNICYRRVAEFFSDSPTYQDLFANLIPKIVSIENIRSIDSFHNIESEDILLDLTNMSSSTEAYGKVVKSLFTLCVDLIQSLQRYTKKTNTAKTACHSHVCRLKPLKTIVFESIKNILYTSYHEDIESEVDPVINFGIGPIDNITINSINTMKIEAFENLQESLGVQEHFNFSDDFDNDQDDHLDETDFNAENETDDSGWVSQLQVQEFRSCYISPTNVNQNMGEDNNRRANELLVGAQIKLEPVDDFTDENLIDTSIVKMEPLQGLHALNEMTHIPDCIITKTERIDPPPDEDRSALTPSSTSFNDDSFEQFVKCNKMIQFLDDTGDDIFSQSGLRVRRQHEPDLDQGNDIGMSLLVPQTFKPLHVVEAKGSLMATSSDDGENSKRNTGKKKDKRRKKYRKDAKTTNSKQVTGVKDKTVPEIKATKSKETPVSKVKTIPESELAVLTRRMREKIRQEEKKVESSDSDSDTTLYMLNVKKDKSKKEIDKVMLPKNRHIVNTDNLKESKKNNDSIQCSNVDSTAKISNGFKLADSKKINNFTGFSVIDQNEITNYQKMMQFVYDKIIPSEAEENLGDDTSEQTDQPIINADEPVELLECEPAMPIFDEESNERPGPKTYKRQKNLNVVEKDNLKFTSRHGWQCFTIDPADTKLYQDTQIFLEKLPESFVQTYMEYQELMDKDIDDQEVDRLTNLQSLNRSISKESKERKSKVLLKSLTSKEISSAEPNSGNFSGSTSPANSDIFDELAPSDDEEIPNAENKIPPMMPVRSSENNLAKNILMNDHDSDSDGAGGKKIKKEPTDHEEMVENPELKRRPGPKSKTKFYKPDPESLMLTADKMMNKELHLLHAPVVLQENCKIKTEKDLAPKEEHKPIKKNTRKQSKERVKNEDDSSSEEEKQWVSTKEKLLKRMGKKEDAIADDAKRAKLVSEFIERRNDTDRPNKRQSGQGRRGRATRKMLERQKQLRVLSKELFGESMVDGVSTGKRGAAAGLFKGRRNIRKVIDKKSLARSTVVANMEEFERKRRLNMRQNKLREVLGCEEGVNVLVINDEVCLEYDFEEQRPVVTVHQFFTKVMKAHQYEGVKFMWDACFESLGRIEAGHPGGGCILAHCMGLGKTLQVLALLHTVLTHPRVGMQRVLVCCPLSTVLNWVDEIHKWIGPVTHEIKVFELSKLRKTYERAYQLEDWYNGGGIFIIGYELFRSLTTLDPVIDDIRPTIINKIRTALLDPGPDIIICDEGHLLKNDCSVLAVAMSRVVTKRRIVLTGTPMQNNLREYFCMVNFIKPNLLGTYSEYSNRFENPIMNGQHRDSREEDIKLMKARTHILHKVLEGCLQRQEASVLYPYLPKKHEYTVFIPLTHWQWDLYNHYMANYARTSRQSILKDFHILQKIWSHPQVLHNFQMKSQDKKDRIKAEKLEDDLAQEDQEADIKPAETEVWWLQYLAEGDMLDKLESSNKFVAVFRILHECVALGDKVLIFSTSLFCLDALEFFLKKIKDWSLGQEYYRLDGSVPPEVRQKWCREFNAENNIKTKLFLISTRAGCLGLNMTAANRVIILDTSWNPAHDIQSIFRVYRFGQKKDCYIYRLVALGTMEQKIYERSVTKQAVACRVVDEQQIDRHYNLAELTELYSVDELGHSVAGGVAVGVSDVALLRVARDAAVHAVHEHDSLLRGSGEQGLPEHERAAAWNQFQQEHEHKQMQNDLSASKAASIALKRLEMEHLRQQALYPKDVKQELESDLNQTQVYQNPMLYSLLVPKEEPKEKRGRKPKPSNKVVQCCIPINMGSTPGPSQQPTSIESDVQQEMVTKITNILIKHNFMQNQFGPKQISDLVAKVKKMVATGEPMKLGPEFDELSSSIANVLLNREEPPMPALTNVERPVPSISDTSFMEAKKRGRPRKEKAPPEVAPPTTPPSPQPMAVEEPVDGRRTSGRRKAALAAEMQFDAQQDVIDVDDDGAQEEVPDDVWENDEDFEDTEPVMEPEPQTVQQKKKKDKKDKATDKPKKGKMVEEDPSIVLSDDEAVEITTPAPAAPTTSTKSASPENTEVVPLHPSLLTNSNFIKIVAHTYLEGNPMMDEDAATLAAQYSTLKTLKESESEGKPIVSGAVYDIAVQVLGKDVLRKLQAANPKVSDSSGDSTNKIHKILGPSAKSMSPTPSPVPAVKPKSGPKSKVMKNTKQETSDVTVASSSKANLKKTATVTKFQTVTPIKLSKTPVGATVHTSSVSDECILPDDEEVHVVNDPEPVNTYTRKKINLERAANKTAPPDPSPSVIPVSVGRGPAPVKPSDTTICLDSDEEDNPPAPTPTLTRVRAIQYTKSQPAPVPVALTGPNARPIPLPSTNPISQIHSMRPTFFTLSPCGTRAVPFSVSASPAGSQPVPVSISGPQPVPISLTGPNGPQPVPISMSGPDGPQLIPVSFAGQGRSQPIPVSLVGPDGSQSVPMSYGHLVPVSLSGPGRQQMTYTGHNSQPVPISLVDSDGRPVAMSAAQGAIRLQSGQFSAQQTPPRTMTNPTSSSTTTHSTRPAEVTLNEMITQPTPGNKKFTIVQKNSCKPGDVFRISKAGVVEMVHRKVGKTSPAQPVTHTIDDDEPAPQNVVQKQAASQKTTQKLIAAQKVTQKSVAAQKVTQKSVAAQKETPAVEKPAPTPSKPAAAQNSVEVTLETQSSSAFKKRTKHTSRRDSSSSSSSERSRSSSPLDPLAILKDVVHIQAPDKPIFKISAPLQNKDHYHSKSDSDPPKPASMVGRAGNKTDKNIANSKSSASLDLLQSKATKKASGSSKVQQISDSVDLTETNESGNRSGTQRTTTKSDTFRLSSKTSKTNTLSNDKKKEIPLKLVGTSQSIILDGKSKSLKVDNTSKVMQAATSMGSATIKQKPVEKRPASTALVQAPKKKKTELMTLKDFNIDDIEDIIELE